MPRTTLTESIVISESVHVQAQDAIRDGKTFEGILPQELRSVVEQVIRATAEGKTITLRTLPEELSTTEAARQLGMSRPTLMKLVRNGDLASHKVGSHTRLLLEDVRTFQRTERQRQRDTLDRVRNNDDNLTFES